MRLNQGFLANVAHVEAPRLRTESGKQARLRGPLIDERPCGSRSNSTPRSKDCLNCTVMRMCCAHGGASYGRALGGRNTSTRVETRMVKSITATSLHGIALHKPKSRSLAAMYYLRALRSSCTVCQITSPVRATRSIGRTRLSKAPVTSTLAGSQ